MTSAQIIKEIARLKEQRNAVILGHFYQRPEVQDIADYVGDSYGLSKQAAATTAEVIVFCGVHFMAESAYILSPGKTVLLPELEAGCPMADMADEKELVALKAKHPEAAVVSYVNTSAAVKAESDICCTSANVLQVIESLPHKEVIFTPDRNMGRYIADKTDKRIILWEGYCYTHDRMRAEDFARAKRQHPDALTVVHPECPPEVLALADHITGTSGMMKLAASEPQTTFIIGTESGMGYALGKTAPGKKFIFPSDDMICATMKLTSLESVLNSLKNLEHRITVPEAVREKAYRALNRMLQVV